MEERFLKERERLDDLQMKGYRIIQHPDKFCFGMDAVLLSGFARVYPGERVLDLGTGTGVIPILLEAKTKGSRFCGLEIQPESADMARRSVEYNCNPPYMGKSAGLVNPMSAKAIARHEILCSLEDVIREAARILPAKGRCYFVHRPFRMVEIFTLMHQYGIEPKRMHLVHPYRVGGGHAGGKERPYRGKTSGYL